MSSFFVMLMMCERLAVVTGVYPSCCCFACAYTSFTKCASDSHAARNQSALHTYCSKLVHIHNSKMWLIVACICDFLMLQCTALGKSSKCVRRLEFYPFSEVSHSRYLNRLTTHLKTFTKKNRRRCVRQIITGKGYFSPFLFGYSYHYIGFAVSV